MFATFIAAIVLVLSREPEQLVSSRPCSFKEPFAKTLREMPPPSGITLLPGFVTGMTKREVRALNRDLMSSEPRGWFEFAPGVRGRARANFSKKGELLESVNLRGFTPQETYAALVRDFGPPDLRKLRGTIKDVQIRGPGEIGGWTERAPKEESLKWCRGARDIELWMDEDQFWVWITPVYPQDRR